MSAPTATPLDHAIGLLRRGQPLEAEAFLSQRLKDAEARAGARGAEAADAWFDLSCLFNALGDTERAAAALRRAADTDARTPEALRKRLTVLMNLGQVLERLERFDEAEQVLREGVEGRARFYGKTHPGYAFGLAPLAWVLSQEKRHEALPLMEEALQILWEAGHPYTAEVTAQRAFLLVAAGEQAQALGPANNLPPELLEACAREARGRAQTVAPELAAAVLEPLCHLMEQKLGPHHAETLQTLAELGETARQGGLHELRVRTFTQLAERFSAMGDGAQEVNALLALALAQDEAGNAQAGDECYTRAAARARQLGDAELVSQVLRNQGLFLAERGLEARAEAAMIEAVKSAPPGGEMWGRALVAHALFQQHRDRHGPAREQLQQALAALPPEHPDALCARSHLDALMSGDGCGCGRMDKALDEALRELVTPHLPEGLLESLSFSPEKGLNVRLAREPSVEEQELLNRVLRQAMTQLSNRMRQQGYR
ncbi:tetratricopeptide repeat protein [Archangium gephyra]|uniref:tetratricopeptide repeat protein n=1 Tax=Archangium gephyra TaxID=48 RepID=UPI0035D4572F